MNCRAIQYEDGHVLISVRLTDLAHVLEASRRWVADRRAERPEVEHVERGDLDLDEVADAAERVGRAAREG